VQFLQVGFVREAQYTTWLTNVVLVKKPTGKWPMCTNYTNLNKACQNDGHTLPSTDQLVDGVARNNMLSFLNAYSCYN